jgi:DNA adenine methylase
LKEYNSGGDTVSFYLRRWQMAVSSAIKRHGGKAYLAKRLIELMPQHTRYCETHFGSGAVLFQKPCEGVAEFVNDIDRELLNFWQVLRDTPDRMLRYLWATPFSPDSFSAAVSNLASDDRVRRATGFFIRNRQSRQALGKSFATPTRRIRRGMNEQVSAWLSAVEGLPEVHARLKRVEIRCQDAVKFIEELDSPETLFYCDPPYVQETRNCPQAYEHEMSFEDHEMLLAVLGQIEGKFLLSGYPHWLYEAARSSTAGSMWTSRSTIRPARPRSRRRRSSGSG